MKAAAIFVVDLVLGLVLQLPVLLVLVAATALTKGAGAIYYRVARLRRLLKGEPLHQAHDHLIGR